MTIASSTLNHVLVKEYLKVNQSNEAASLGEQQFTGLRLSKQCDDKEGFVDI